MTSKRKERRIFVDSNQVINHTIFFSQNNIHYLRNVLHMRPGDRVIAFDGFRGYDVVLRLAAESKWLGEISSFLEPTQSYPITVCLAFGCVRPAPTEEIIRHGTELGVEQFHPLIMELSNRKPQSARSRWVKIAESACAQSGRLKKPQINAPMGLSTFLDTHSSNSKFIHLSMQNEVIPLWKVLDRLSTDSVTFVIGPEGGITQLEHDLLAYSSSVEASLGLTTLRTETAAIVAVGIAMNWGLCQFKR